ncbi:hypothetical protein EDB89DRAFT_2081854 [Lactarius sanguifluus]|nr:hypothetical protein EDB89DRAFT_2081854 [Lactarius sanguifluus]
MPLQHDTQGPSHHRPPRHVDTARNTPPPTDSMPRQDPATANPPRRPNAAHRTPPIRHATPTWQLLPRHPGPATTTLALLPPALLRHSQALHHPQSSDPCHASLSSDNYDFTQFGQWDGDSASYFNDNGQPLTPRVLPSILAARISASPLTPLTSPSTFVQEFEQGSSTTGTQYEYILTDIHGTPLSGLPSPITRPTTPLEYREEYNPEFDIRTQVAVHSTPRSPTLELIYPDPPSEPTPISHPSSAPPSVAEQGPLSPPPNQENILPVAFFRPPSCVNSPEEHPHQYIAVYTEEGESWRPSSNSLKEYFQRIPRTTSIVLHPHVFPSVTPFRIPPPHLYTILPRAIDPASHPNFPALHICSKAILDLPSINLPLGTSLIYLFEFGETWDHDTHSDFLNDLSAVVDACNDQLLFWHLSDIATDQLQLWTRTDYLWFNYIPPRRDYLIQQLQHGNPICFIEKFCLSYEEIQINFGKI